VLSTPRKSPQPPLLFLGCLLAGWGLGSLHSLPLGLPWNLRLILGLVLLLVVVVHGGWGLLTFRRMGTTPAPNGQVSALLVSGPFRWTRNPLYLALTTFFVWVGVMLDSAWMLCLTPVLVLLLERLVIVREEARLQSQFGDEYRAYTRRVRRWL
jgi:protein-S-isoprenylcysteine O-methyltransferase Ste14